MFEAEVLSEKWLNLRADKSKTSAVLAEMKHGEIVSVLDDYNDDTWWRVRYKGIIGYAMSGYLRRLETEPIPCECEEEDECEEECFDDERPCDNMEELLNARDALIAAIDLANHTLAKIQAEIGGE